jgi:spore coat polysaccharide biosynthesis protein SpsF
MSFTTEQEDFWATEFGDEYIDRNQGWNNNAPMFSRVLKTTNNINSIIELGCNIDLNLKALNLLLPESKLTGVEINKNACDILKKWHEVDVVNSSIFDYSVKKHMICQ